MNDKENKISCYSDRFSEEKKNTCTPCAHKHTEYNLWSQCGSASFATLNESWFTHQFTCHHVSPASEVPGRTLHGVLVFCTRKEIRNDINQFPLTAETQMEMAFGPYCLLEGHS